MDRLKDNGSASHMDNLIDIINNPDTDTNGIREYLIRSGKKPKPISPFAFELPTEDQVSK